MHEQPTDGGSSDQPRAEPDTHRPGDRLLNFSWMAIAFPFLAVVLLIFVFLGGNSTLSAVVTIPTIVLVFALAVARITIRTRRAQADLQRRAPRGDQAQT